MPIEIKRGLTYFTKRCLKDLDALDAQSRTVIEHKLEEIYAGNVKPDIKKLTQYHFATYRLKIGNYRLLFNRNDETGYIIFVMCRNRKDLY